MPRFVLRFSTTHRQAFSEGKNMTPILPLQPSHETGVSLGPVPREIFWLDHWGSLSEYERGIAEAEYYFITLDGVLLDVNNHVLRRR